MRNLFKFTRYHFVFDVPWKSFWTNMHPHICPRFNKLVNMSNPGSVLCLSHSFSFDWRSLSKDRRFSKFFIQLNFLLCGSWWRLWAHKGIMHCSKMYKIFNIPSKFKHINQHSPFADLQRILRIQWACLNL